MTNERGLDHSMVIRAALIDIGNVLSPFSHDAMCAQMASLAGVAPERVRTEFLQSDVFDRFERGTASGHDVHEWFCEHFGVHVTLDDLRVACSSIFTPDPLWPPLLDALHVHGIRTVALSNTCSWHVEWIEATDVVLQRLDALATSWTVGSRKPQPELFHAAVRLAACRAEECAYIDDIQAYVDAASALGIRAHLYVDVPSTVELLRSLGCDPFAPVPHAAVNVRAARPRDALGMAATMHLAMKVGYRDIFPPDGPDVSVARLASYWAHVLGDRQVHAFAADSAGVAVGTVLIRRTGGGAGRFERLFVHPQLWGGGTGVDLYDTAIACARSLGLSELTLDVLEDNHRARGIYDRRGWSEVPGSRHRAPGLPEDTAPMVLDYRVEL